MEGERERERERGRERETELTRSMVELARSRAQAHKPWDHDLSRSQMLNQLSHPGTLLWLFDFFKDLFIYFWKREKVWVEKRQRERRREREDPKQAACCQCRTWHWAQTHKLWDHDLSRSQMLNRLSHPCALKVCNNLKMYVANPKEIMKTMLRSI